MPHDDKFQGGSMEKLEKSIITLLRDKLSRKTEGKRMK